MPSPLTFPAARSSSEGRPVWFGDICTCPRNSPVIPVIPIGFILTGGEASDYAAVDDLMALPLPKPKALLADKGYDGDRFRENLLMRGILPIIPPRSNRKAPVHPDYRRYRDRNRIERMFGKLKQQRRIATRYDKTVLSFESFLNLAAARLWLKSFVNTTQSP